MKTNKILSVLIGLTAFAFALFLNYQYAENDYGVLENTISTHVLAQSSSGNGGDGGSSTGGSSGGDSGGNSGGNSSSGGGDKFQEVKVTKTVTTVTTTDQGWSWDFGLNVWLLNGKVSKKQPNNQTTSTTTYESKCCKKSGPLTVCDYDPCPENI